MFVSGRVNWLKHIKSQDCQALPPTNSSFTRPRLKTWWFRLNILNDWYNQHRKYACIYIYIYFLGVPPNKSSFSHGVPMILWKHDIFTLHDVLFQPEKNNKNNRNWISNFRCIKGPGILGKPTCERCDQSPSTLEKLTRLVHLKITHFLKRKINYKKPLWLWLPCLFSRVYTYI